MVLYIVKKIKEIITDTIPSYRLDILPERYNEAILKKTELSMNENEGYEKIKFKIDGAFVGHLSLC